MAVRTQVVSKKIVSKIKLKINRSCVAPIHIRANLLAELIVGSSRILPNTALDKKC